MNSIQYMFMHYFQKGWWFRLVTFFTILCSCFMLFIFFWSHSTDISVISANTMWSLWFTTFFTFCPINTVWKESHVLLTLTRRRNLQIPNTSKMRTTFHTSLYFCIRDKSAYLRLWSSEP